MQLAWTTTKIWSSPGGAQRQDGMTDRQLQSKSDCDSGISER